MLWACEIFKAKTFYFAFSRLVISLRKTVISVRNGCDLSSNICVCAGGSDTVGRSGAILYTVLASSLRSLTSLHASAWCIPSTAFLTLFLHFRSIGHTASCSPSGVAVVVVTLVASFSHMFPDPLTVLREVRLSLIPALFPTPPSLLAKLPHFIPHFIPHFSDHIKNSLALLHSQNIKE